MSDRNTIVGEELLDAISRHVFLVMLHISWPKLSYQIVDAVVEVGSGDEKTEIAEELRTNPQWRLLPEKWRKKLVNLEGRARSLLSHASISFAARGMSVLPVSRAQEIFSGLRALRTEMEQYRDEFVQEYEGILQSLEDRLDADLYKKVQGKLPESEQVAEKFGIVWAIIPAGGRGGATAEQVDTIEAALTKARDRLNERKLTCPREVHNALAAVGQIKQAIEVRERQITDDEAAELIDEARDQMSKFTNDMLEDMAREPRQVLRDAADNLLEALKDPSRMIRNGTINQVREAFEMVEGFEFLAGPDLIAAIRGCRERLESVTPQQLNSDAEIGARLAAGLQGVRDEAADTRAAAKAVRQFRRIRIRDESPEPDRQPAAV